MNSSSNCLFYPKTSYSLGRVHFSTFSGKQQLKLSVLLQNFVTVVTDCLGRVHLLLFRDVFCKTTVKIVSITPKLRNCCYRLFRTGTFLDAFGFVLCYKRE